MTIRLTEELDEQLTDLAVKLGTSKQALIIQGAELLVHRYRRDADVDQMFEEILREVPPADYLG